MTDKQKNIELIGRNKFFQIWVGMGLLVFLIETLLYLIGERFLLYSSLTNYMNFTLLITMMIMHRVHQGLIYRWLGVHLSWWWLFSTIAWIVNYFVVQEISSLFAIQLYYATPAIFVVLPFLLVHFIVITIVQAWMLRPYLKNVWLYILFVICIDAIFNIALMGIPYQNGTTDTLVFIFNETAFYVILTGLALLWLDHITYEKVDEIS